MDFSERRRNWHFALSVIIVLAILIVPLKELILLSFSLDQSTYSHILLIPLISSYLIACDRKRVFSGTSPSPGIGGLLFFIGVIFYSFASILEDEIDRNDYFSLMASAAFLGLLGGYVFFYGTGSLKRRGFPFLFLVFIVPIPSWMLGKVITFLLQGSASATQFLLGLAGLPFIREGDTFHLSEFSVEISEECSGIRSSIALFITSILAGQFFLKRFSSKVILSLAAIPLAIVKNAIRITTLTLLARYVDIRFLTDSPLHRQGGIVFFAIALLIMMAVLYSLRRAESRKTLPLKEAAGLCYNSGTHPTPGGER